MGGTVCTLSAAGRHSLSMGITYLDLALAYAGDLIIMIALYLKFVLESQVAVVIGSHAGALAYFLLTVGFLLCFVCAAAAKANYDAGSREMTTLRTCKMMLFTLVCQGLTVLLLLAAIILCLVHKALIRDVLHNGIISAIKLYRVNDRIKAGINRIQAGFQCCGSRSLQDWFKIPWVPLKYLDVDHPDVARYIVDGEFIIDNAPYSCCDVHVGRSCVHHNVQNVSRHLRVGPTGTLYTVGCNKRLEEYWKSNVLNPVLGLLLLVTVLMALSMTLSRLLQTSLQEAVEKEDPLADGDAFCIRACPRGLCALSTSATQVTTRNGNQTDGKGDGGDGGDREGKWFRPKISSQNTSSNCAPSLGPRRHETMTRESGDGRGRGVNKRDRSHSREGRGDTQDVNLKKPYRDQTKDGEQTRAKVRRDRGLHQVQGRKEWVQKREKYRKDQKDRDQKQGRCQTGMDQKQGRYQTGMNQKQGRDQTDIDQKLNKSWTSRMYRQSKYGTGMRGKDKNMVNCTDKTGNRMEQLQTKWGIGWNKKTQGKAIAGKREIRRTERKTQAREGIHQTGQYTRL